MKPTNSIPMRVLLVDDEKPLLRGVKYALQDELLVVDTADTLEAGYALLKAREYDFVVSDMRLSDSEQSAGLDILRFVKEFRPSTRVIIMSGFGSSDIKHKAFSLGAERFFDKPVSADVLRHAIMESREMEWKV